MTTPRVELRGIALSYALLGTLSFALGAILIAIAWSGSWARLWHDVVVPEYLTLSSFAAFAVLLWTLAGLSLRYLELSRTWRFATLGVSVVLTLWNIGGAVRETIRPPEVSFVQVWTLIGVRWLTALAYSICSYSLWRHRASNLER